MDEAQGQIIEKMNAEFLKLTLMTDKVYSMLKTLQEPSLAPTTSLNMEWSSNAYVNMWAEKFAFPLNSVSDVLGFNKEISNSEEYQEYLVSFSILYIKLLNFP